VRDVRGAIFCEECLAAHLGVGGAGHAAPPPLPPDVLAQQRGLPSPTLAAVLGFIPGVGAFYNAQYQKGVVHVVIFAALCTFAGSDVDQISTFFGLMIPLFIFYMAWDAYKTAQSRVTGEPVPDPLGINNIFGLDNVKAGAGAAGTAPGAAVGGAAPAAAAGGAVAGTAMGGAGARPPVAAFVLIGMGLFFMLGEFSHELLRFALPMAMIAFGVWKGMNVWNRGGAR